MEVPNEPDGDISGLGQSIERLRLRLEKGRTLRRSGPDAGSEGDDETSDQDGKKKNGVKEEDSPCQTPKTVGPPLDAGGQSSR